MHRINLLDRATPREGTISFYWFENENIGLERTRFHRIQVEFDPLDTGCDYVEQPEVPQLTDSKSEHHSALTLNLKALRKERVSPSPSWRSMLVSPGARIELMVASGRLLTMETALMKPSLHD